MYIGIDTGGTFTDFVYYDGAHLRVHKVLSTPDAPEKAILQGLRELGVSLQNLKLTHGSTVATNAVLEGKGVPTVYITNRGLKDVLTIGRQTRFELYQLQPLAPPEPVPQTMCLETGGRLAADGSVVEPLTGDDLHTLKQEIARLQPQAVAINLLFSFLDDRFERQIEQVLPHDVFVSRSSYVLPEYKEYERGIATWLNAWVGPIVSGYLQRLQQAVQPASVSVMQSSGGTMAASEAARQAVRLLFSGPAGGLAAVQALGKLVGGGRWLSFDMGGTSTDVALIDGDIKLTSLGQIGPYPVAVPMVDMHTIGAGGGSIAYLDQGGMLQVGPQSAGANPGPACYALGGDQPTVTDANVVLGRIPAGTLLAGRLPIDGDQARRVMASLGKKMGLTPEQTALGIVRIANEHMARALRVISVQRGFDTRLFTLVPFGGAGSLHVCQVADLLGMRRVMIPNHSGVLSALGMLVAVRERQISHTYKNELSQADAKQFHDRYLSMESQAANELANEGVRATDIVFVRSLDLRYRGQSHYLNVPWHDAGRSQLEFHRLHEHRYGHRLNLPVECVNLRVSAKGPAPASLSPLPGLRDISTSCTSSLSPLPGLRDVSTSCTSSLSPLPGLRDISTSCTSLQLASLPVLEQASPEKWVKFYSDEVDDSTSGPAHGIRGTCDAPVWERAKLVGRTEYGPMLVTDTHATAWIEAGWDCRADQWGNLWLKKIQ